MTPFTEDRLVQQTTADYLQRHLGWTSVYAYNNEDFGADSLLGRISEREVVLTRSLAQKIAELNPQLPPDAIEDVIRTVISSSTTLSPLAINREKYDLLRKGVPVTYKNVDGEQVKEPARLIDFDNPENNEFLAARELWIQGELYRRRPDIIGFVNGLPVIFIECKNIHTSLRAAYEKNLADYRDTIPHLFHHNALLILGNGDQASMGSITSAYEHFHEWKRLDEDDPGVVDMETLLKGVLSKKNLLDLLENFIVYDDSRGETRKILARNHQFLGVNRAIQAVTDMKVRKGKLGVFWHTQGAGKSYSMVFFTRKVHRKLGGNYTFVVLTDRQDLDAQIYKTFAGCGVVDNDSEPCRPESGEQLRTMLGEHKTHVFSLIQKFNEDVDPAHPYSERDDIIVMTDEAHRTQYGDLALNMRNALPNASFIGFTGTPLFREDEITRQVFGEYVSTYDFQRAVEDKATVPLYYDARGDKLELSTDDLNDQIAAKLEELEIEGVEITERLERALSQQYHILTAPERLERIAQDFVEHYSTSWETGKAMFICIDKVTCVRMYNLIEEKWAERIEMLEKEVLSITDKKEQAIAERQIAWMRKTRTAVVVSEEQGEVEKFRGWELDIQPHRRLIKEGIDLPPAMQALPQYRSMGRMPLDEAYKAEDHPFRIAIVCAMWLTGFDVPSLANLYLDKPLKAHTLMQAIARANRVHEGKNNGLIIDYCGILKNLRAALATFAGTGDGGREDPIDTDPAKTEDELLASLEETIAMVSSFLDENGASLEDMLQSEGFNRVRAVADAITAAKEAANQDDETRKRFGVMCREVFKKFRACLTVKGVNDFRLAYKAIRLVYQSLERDVEKADISDILRELQRLAGEAITVRPTGTQEETAPYDISQINFDLLRRGFRKSTEPNTIVQSLKEVVDQRLQRLMAQNLTRTDYQERFEQLVAEYNHEKDRVTIEQTFEELMRLAGDLDEEAHRAVREGLNEETLAVFDLLKKADLSPRDIKQIKSIAWELLEAIKAEIKAIDRWQEKEATRDALKMRIRNFLWSEETGLPVESYNQDDVSKLTEKVFLHIFRAYPRVPSPVYATALAA